MNNKIGELKNLYPNITVEMIEALMQHNFFTCPASIQHHGNFEHSVAVANDNYPNIIQHGDAFAVREDSWKHPQVRSEWLDESLEVI